MAAADDIDRLRLGFSSVRVSDNIENTPLTPTTPTSRMHLLSGLRTAPKSQASPKTRGYTHPNVNGVPNGYDLGMSSPNPRIVLSPNGYGGPNYYTQRQPRGHKHQHSRGSSVSSLQIPRAPSPGMRPDTPDSLPDSFDPQLYASLQQQYLDLLATNQYLVQQHHHQQLQVQQQYNMSQAHQLAFLSPPRTPVSAYSPQYIPVDSPSPYLSPGPERQRFPSPRRSRFDQYTSEEPTEFQLSSPSPATSPSPASSESSWRRGHRRGKSSISNNGNVIKPIRQPYGPPPMETLLENKASGVQSPNFASRLRRKAVSRLMLAGMERRQSPSVPGFSFHDAQGKESPEPQAEAVSDDDVFDPRRRSALF